jgi:hypothetical protein
MSWPALEKYSYLKVYHSFRETGENDRISSQKKGKKGQGGGAQDMSTTNVVSMATKETMLLKLCEEKKSRGIQVG